jgi:hypothetical protein
VLPAEDRLASQERRHRGRQAYRDRGRGQQRGLPPQNRQAPVHGGEARPDQPAGVFAGDQQHAEHPGRDLRELHAGQAHGRRIERAGQG